MSGTTELNYPPEEVIQSVYPNRKNFEHIILWMLKNNENVEWADFKEDPLNISQSTLSNYINKLDSKGFIQRIKRGVYCITPSGEERYNELSRAKEVKRRLSYPPNVIADSRNYDDIILWMAYNNNYLKWSDFQEDRSPIFINQSSLSKNLNMLLDTELIRKENKEYRITRAGKVEYSRMLRTYDLDRQSILNEESKRIGEITKRTIGFFEKYNIEDKDIKFRFLHYVLTLSYEKLKGSLDSEEQFNKILLFLSMNHPNQYPAYTSSGDFSQKYGIDILDLEFNIRKIIEKSIYPTKFFKLDFDENKSYFFQANEKIEKVLSAITEDYITKFTYLNKLYEKSKNGKPKLTLECAVDVILEEICESLFHKELKHSLKEFLPDYINYLAYKMETERRLDEITDKLEGTIWQEFQYFSAVSDVPEPDEGGEENYYLYPKIFDILEEYYVIPEISSMVEELKKEMKDKEDYTETLNLINSTIESGISGVEINLFKAIVLCYMNKYPEAIDLIEKELKYERYEDDERVYVTASFILAFAYTALGKIDSSLKILDLLFELYTDHPITLAAKALVFGYSIIYDFDTGVEDEEYILDLIDQLINLDSNTLSKVRYYQFKSTILEQIYKLEEALEEISSAIDLDTDVVDLYYWKSKILASLERFAEAISLLEDSMKKFPKNNKHFLMQKAYVLKQAGDLEKGLEIIDKLLEEYPDDDSFYNNKAYWHLYIYKENQDKGIEDESNKNAAIETIKLLTKNFPKEGNYFDSYGEILLTIGDYKNSIKQYEKAIETEPKGWFVPASYLGLGRCYENLGDYRKAEAYLLKARKIIRYCFCHIKHKKEWIEEIEYHLKNVMELKQKS
ncbi:MAG: tetratricopeptide repeat protein [Promethearchaeota archaeon]